MSEDSPEVKQQQRTYLRERFLRMLGALSGVKADVRLYDKTSVQCQLGATDVEFEKMQVSNLVTPMGVFPHAVLRTKDITSIHVQDLGKPPTE
ncbi:hypothetical protein ACOMHN_020841 [Nucella lapillus]